MDVIQGELFDPHDPVPEVTLPPATYFDRITREATTLNENVKQVTFHNLLELSHDTSVVTTGEYSGDRTVGFDAYQVALVNSDYHGTPKKLKNIPSAQRLSKVGARFSRFANTLLIADLTEYTGTINRAHAESDALIFLTFATLIKDVHERSIIDAAGYSNLSCVEFTSGDPRRFQEMMSKMGILLKIKDVEIPRTGRRKGRSINPDVRVESRNKVDEQPQDPVTFIIDYSEFFLILEPLTQQTG